MTYEELLKTRRSVRQYQNRPVEIALVEEIISESTLAPNAGNEQPWKFIIINDKSLIRAISDESKKNILARIEASPDDYAKKYQPMLEKKEVNVFHNAPCVVMIVGNTEQRNLLVDCALAASYFMLSAASRGLGTCWVNLGKEIRDPDLIARLGLTDDLTIVAPITLGYAELIPPAPKRNAPEILKVIS